MNFTEKITFSLKKMTFSLKKNDFFTKKMAVFQLEFFFCLKECKISPFL